MAENKLRQSLDLIEEAFGQIAQARENLRDARELITIMEAENARIGSRRTEVGRRPTTDRRPLASVLSRLSTLN